MKGNEDLEDGNINNDDLDTYVYNTTTTDNSQTLCPPPPENVNDDEFEEWQ